MNRLFLATALTAFSLIVFHPVSFAGDSDTKALQGVWIGQSMEVDGKVLPADAAKKMRFKFQGDKFFIAGNFKDDGEEACVFRLDPKKSPKHFDFTPPKEEKAILGIYEVKGDELKVCLRHSSSAEGRPTEFATKADSKLIYVVFKKK